MVDKQTELTDLFKMLMQEKTPEYESKFFKKLNETVFWVPIMLDQQGEGRKTLQLLTTADQRKFVPAFLHKKSKLGRFMEEQLMEMPYDKLKYLIIDLVPEINGIVINPFEENIILDQKLMEVVDAHTMGMTLKREEYRGRISLRTPEMLPIGLKQTLVQHFKVHLQVEAAWLMKARRENKIEDYWLLLIEFKGEKIQLFPLTAEVVKPYMKLGQRFELVQKNPELSTATMETARIYERPRSQNLL